MRQLTIHRSEEGIKLLRYLSKYMDEAPMSFLHKMLRKKNIKLNGNKASGDEILKENDIINIYMLDESIENFRSKKASKNEGLILNKERYDKKTDTYFDESLEIEVIYEDEHYVIFNKPAGILSQKAKKEDYSINEYLIDYCMKNKEQSEISKPSICNRLDRNTSGIILCAKDMSGANQLNKIIKDHRIEKYYTTIVVGELKQTLDLVGYLSKKSSRNQSVIYKNKDAIPDAKEIHSIFTPIKTNGDYTLVKAQIISGKSHQIRAHLESVGYKVLGDGKYGDHQINQRFKKKYGLKHHLLHARSVTFTDESFPLANKTITAEYPKIFKEIMDDLF